MLLGLEEVIRLRASGSMNTSHRAVTEYPYPRGSYCRTRCWPGLGPRVSCVCASSLWTMEKLSGRQCACPFTVRYSSLVGVSALVLCSKLYLSLWPCGFASGGRGAVGCSQISTAAIGWVPSVLPRAQAVDSFGVLICMTLNWSDALRLRAVVAFVGHYQRRLKARTRSPSHVHVTFASATRLRRATRDHCRYQRPCSQARMRITVTIGTPSLRASSGRRAIALSCSPL